MGRKYSGVLIIYVILLCSLLFGISCSEEKKKEVPDLSDWVFSKSYQQDIIQEIPGKETTRKIYQRTRNDTQELLHIFELSNGKIYAFGIRDKTTGKQTIFWDKNNDGDFEQEAKKGKIDIADYGYISMPVLEADAAQEEVKLPDLSNWTFMEERKGDLIGDIPGEETTVKIYQRNDNEQEQLHILELPDGKVFGFGTVNNETQDRKMYWDRDNNGRFEFGMAIGRINKKAYGY